MHTVQLAAPGAAPELVKVPLREPGPGAVRVSVEACGACHSDLLIAAGLLPGTTFPVAPGHEIAGRIDALGDGVEVCRSEIRRRRSGRVSVLVHCAAKYSGA